MCSNFKIMLKECVHKRVHIMWLYLYEILEDLKLIWGAKNQNSVPSGSIKVKINGAEI